MAQCPHCQNALPDRGESASARTAVATSVSRRSHSPPPFRPRPPAAPTPPRPPEPPSAAPPGLPPAGPGAARAVVSPPGRRPAAPPGGGRAADPLGGPGPPRLRQRAGRDHEAGPGLPDSVLRGACPPPGASAPRSSTPSSIGWIGVVAASLYSALFQSIVGSGVGGPRREPGAGRGARVSPRAGSASSCRWSSPRWAW